MRFGTDGRTLAARTVGDARLGDELESVLRKTRESPDPTTVSSRCLAFRMVEGWADPLVEAVRGPEERT